MFCRLQSGNLILNGLYLLASAACGVKIRAPFDNKLVSPLHHAAPHHTALLICFSAEVQMKVHAFTACTFLHFLSGKQARHKIHT